MEKLNDEAQWIVLMGFMVAAAFFFLALVINQSTLVGQTTAEGVLEFPKEEIRDVKSEVAAIVAADNADEELWEDIEALYIARKNAVVDISESVNIGDTTFTEVKIHFNNGVTEYDETAHY
ncbi:hypothetical protein J2129_002406 [Methanofollis sp. W23]|uniref:hypothetical protein n=1 Tax=Methanofollis sp. W23 TaxID=2817849 RepID=UPI001AE55042|nr:hypothetical protein [Methanofollis sp. W23]MBP2146952.1 hypothetical protein [Methanofollis sp. W23]